jgi:predicted transglutaminase-like cysteine proteinase
MGFAAHDLQIVVLEDHARGLAHAVLAARVGTDVWLLDNQASEPVPAASAVHYEPYYAVNETTRWLHRLPESTSTGR